MTILTQEDIATGKEITYISGLVERILVKDNKPNPKNQYWKPHKVSLLVDGTWSSFDMELKTFDDGNKAPLTVNTGSKAQPKYEKVEEGDEVVVTVKSTNEFNGNIYYTTSRAGIRIKKKGTGQPSKSTQQAQQAKPAQVSAKPTQTGFTALYGEIMSLTETHALVKNQKDNKEYQVVMSSHKPKFKVGERVSCDIDSGGVITNLKKFYVNEVVKAKQNTNKGLGVQVGHALNGGFILHRENTELALLPLCKAVHSATQKVKEFYAKYNVDHNLELDEYGVGAASGNAVLNSCRDCKETDYKKIEEFLVSNSESLLQNEVQKLLAFVKGKVEAKQEVKEEPKKEVKKEKETTKEEEPSIPSFDFDDDVPF